MFEALSDRLDRISTRLRGKGRLSDGDIDEALKDIRLALLEADVALDVVKVFQQRVRDRAQGAEVSASLSPGQQVIKIVNDELTRILGGEALKITYESKPPTVVLMAGLQGSGKTTSTVKLAQWFKAQGRHPLLIGADLQRPAAVEQLRTLAAQISVPVFSAPGNPVKTAKKGIAEAKKLGCDVVICDTAGRLSIDVEMMEEIASVSATINPSYTFLVLDAMAGQDAVNVARSFHETLEIDGVILTKLDGDARGGAALSVREVVGRPIAFAGTGEKLEDFELFHPDRMAGRILGMGDVLSLIEKAETVYEEEEAEAAAQRLLDGKFTLEDFLDQMQQLKKLGSLSSIVGMLPGIPKEVRNAEIDNAQIDRVEAMIRSMTQAERENPQLIDTSRRTRIARGSGVNPAQVSQLIRQFKEMQKMAKGMGGMMPGGRKKQRKKGKSGQGGSRVTPAKSKLVAPKGGGLRLPGT